MNGWNSMKGMMAFSPASRSARLGQKCGICFQLGCDANSIASAFKVVKNVHVVCGKPVYDVNEN